MAQRPVLPLPFREYPDISRGSNLFTHKKLGAGLNILGSKWVSMPAHLSTFDSTSFKEFWANVGNLNLDNEFKAERLRLFIQFLLA